VHGLYRHATTCTNAAAITLALRAHYLQSSLPTPIQPKAVLAFDGNHRIKNQQTGVYDERDRQS
jgi:hypothetical protein